MEFGKWNDGREYVDIKGYRFPIKNNFIFEGFNYGLNPYKVVLMETTSRKIRPIMVGSYNSEKYILIEK